MTNTHGELLELLEDQEDHIGSPEEGGCGDVVIPPRNLSQFDSIEREMFWQPSEHLDSIGM